ncbi:MAG: M23 family metallopeptidase [Bacteroidales bacterium]|nr:M23 family metallopeptidase [Bacteroidales bacterium]
MSKEGIRAKLRRKLQISVFTEKSYEQLFSIKLSPITAFIAIGFVAILLIVSVILLVAFTGLKEYIPGYPTGEERRLIMNNLQRSDSLLFEINRRDRMIADIRNALSGELPTEAYSHDSLLFEKKKSNVEIDFTKSEADSIFRAQIEAEERFNIAANATASYSSFGSNLELIHFFTPLKGVVTNKFGEGTGHYGIDIVNAESARVSSILDGTVIFAEWTVETGYIIQIQHDNNIVSIYKHNGKLLKKVGTHVSAGEAIALLGNSGELTTGPHLHFEMWYGGVPLDPENYISFE